jgi:hypothetical protein
MRSFIIAAVAALTFASAANAQMHAPTRPAGPYTWDTATQQCMAGNGQTLAPSFCPKPHCSRTTVPCRKTCIPQGKTCPAHGAH